MFAKLFRKPLKAVSIVGLFMFANGWQVAAADEHEAACEQYVQDKISWDYDGRKYWDPANIKTLCQGTTSPKEPGECFNKVMTGKVNWGSDDKWKWQNAVSLCAGTNNSDERVKCFQDRVSAGTKWNEAILQCQTSGKVIFK